MTSDRHAVRCRSCGALLGRLNGRRDRVTLLPGVAVVLELGSGGFGIICPEVPCGGYRLLRAGRSFREREAVLRRREAVIHSGQID